MASVLAPTLVSAQGYYDDDIYFNPAKVKKTAPLAVSEQPSIDFEEPTYQVYTSNPRDIDEYNRRGRYTALTDSVPGDTTAVTNPDVFQYTERMERFDNPTIVISSGDSRLKELYYTDNVNIYVGLPTVGWSFGLYDTWYSPYYYNSWNLSWGWNLYRPYYGWYDPFWGPSYPYYGWGYSWCYPHYHPYYPEVGRHHYYSDGGRRPFGAMHSPGGRRPELSGRSGYRNTDSYRSTGRRPSSTYYTPSSRPATSRTERPTTTYGGYRGGSTTYSPSQPSSGRRPSYTTPSTDRTPTYRQPSTSSPSRSNSSGGGFRGGSTSGGSRGSFSGGSRGGRR